MARLWTKNCIWCLIVHRQRGGEKQVKGSMCLQLRTRMRLRRLFLGTGVAEERGAELMEFAVLAPLLVMLLMGMIWFGRAYNTTQTLTRAAREGARFAVLPCCASCCDPSSPYPPDSQVRAIIDASLVASALDPSQVQGYSMQRAQPLNPGSTMVDNGVVISFTYPFRFILPFTPIHLTTITIPVRVQMREENQ